MLDIVDIGEQHIAYPDSKTVDFEINYLKYLDITKKMIRYFAPRFYPELRREILENEDILANITTAIMKADWRWNEHYQSKTGKTRTKRAYRNQCCLWEISSYLKRKSRKKNNIATISIDKKISTVNGDGRTLAEIIPDNSAGPVEIISDNEYTVDIKDTISSLLNSGVLTEKEQLFIKLHYLDSRGLADIGREYKITREAVRQNVIRGIKKLQQLAKATKC